MKFLPLVFAAGILSGCATGASRNGVGLIYTDVSDSVTATSNSAATKRGVACASNVLALVSSGDMSIEGAKKAGNITKVATVDYTQNSILGVYTKTCTVVTGE